jgi:DnaJ-class molecular chaperone
MARRGSLNQDYYQTLGLEAGASQDEVRKAYRRLAFDFHPDRNPGDKAAEERFKQISEAYACLADQDKRQRYDRARSGGFSAYGSRGGSSSYVREEEFTDFFFGRGGKNIFSDLQEEFAAFGLRFDEEFLRRVFFQGQTHHFRGIQFGFPGGFSTYRVYHQNTPPSGRHSGLHGAKVFPLLMGSLFASLAPLWMRKLQEKWVALRGAVRGLWANLKAHSPSQAGSDLYYDLGISSQEALAGCQRVFPFTRQGREEKILIKIPPGVRSGTQLRIAGKGLIAGDGYAGNLYIRLRVR